MPDRKKIACCSCGASFHEDEEYEFWEHMNNSNVSPAHKFVYISEEFASRDILVTSERIQ